MIEPQAMCVLTTVVPVMNGHPRDQAKVSVHCRWPLIRGNLKLKCVGRGIDNVAVQDRWPLTTGVAQGRYYCITKNSSLHVGLHKLNACKTRRACRHEYGEFEWKIIQRGDEVIRPNVI